MRIISEENIKFGYVSYEPSYSMVSKFSENLLKGKLLASKCSNCNKVYLPPRVGCNHCFTKEMDLEDIETEAFLTAFTIIHFAPESFSDKAPYIAAVGKFATGHSLLAHLVGVTEMPKIGMKMKLTPQKLENKRVTYKFVKA